LFFDFAKSWFFVFLYVSTTRLFFIDMTTISKFYIDDCHTTVIASGGSGTAVAMATTTRRRRGSRDKPSGSLLIVSA
jgi:hypothetical protein